MARRAVRTHLTGRKRSVRGAAAALLFLIIALQLLSMGYCGTRKFGMHEDEYYSYYSTNRSTGLYLSDRTWVDSGDLRKEFIALPGESLDLALVKTVQSWDVHPPLYYYALRTACYLTPGVFSKWQGLAVNFIGFFFAQLILAALSYHLSGSRAFSLMITAAWGFSPVAFSAVMFIRMYQWLIVWTLLQLLLLVLLMEEMSGPAAGGRCSLPEAPATAAYRSNMKFRSEPRGGDGKSFCASKRPGGTPESRPRRQTPVRLQRMRQHRTTVLLALMALCTFCGFLTQYYYLIILFFEGVCFELYALTHSKGEQRLKTCGGYALAQLLALAAGVLYYPASLSQIFHGYRGREAQTEFIDPSNTLDRWKTFLGLINDQLFAGKLGWFLLAAAVCALLPAITAWVSRYRRERCRKPAGDNTPAALNARELSLYHSEYAILLVSTAASFLVVSKTALILGASSIRYVINLCPLLLFLILLPPFRLITKHAAASGAAPRPAGISQRLAVLLLGSILLVTDSAGLSAGKVQFLYPEDRHRMAYAKEHAEETVVVAYNPANTSHIYFLSNELLTYRRFFCIDESNTAPLDDVLPKSEEGLTAYIADSDNADQILHNLEKAVEAKHEAVLLDTKQMWKKYRIY